jgi:hypothetical protein
MKEITMPEPTITSKNLPPNQQPGAMTTSPAVPPKSEVTPPPLSYDQIEAKPLRSPNFLNLKPKNPNMSLYFGNRAVGEKESGLRYDQLIAMGFRPAKPEEVLTQAGQACPSSLSRDGRIMYGDLILLIIPRADYIGATKWNAENAARRVRRFGQVPVGHEAGQSADGRINPSSALTGLPAQVKTREGRTGTVTAYIPPIVEVDSKTADNSGIPANLAEK